MNTIVINKIEDGVPPPTGNGFSIVAHEIYTYGMSHERLVDTGLEISVPPDHTLDIHGVDFLVMSWTLDGHKLANSPIPIEWPKGRLIVLLYGPLVKEGTKIGEVFVVEQKKAPIRFIQRTPDGGRIVRGDAQIASSTENGEPKS